jgi:hypothetical protein
VQATRLVDAGTGTGFVAFAGDLAPDLVHSLGEKSCNRGDEKDFQQRGWPELRTPAWKASGLRLSYSKIAEYSENQRHNKRGQQALQIQAGSIVLALNPLLRSPYVKSFFLSAD